MRSVNNINVHFKKIPDTLTKLYELTQEHTTTYIHSSDSKTNKYRRSIRSVCSAIIARSHKLIFDGFEQTVNTAAQVSLPNHVTEKTIKNEIWPNRLTPNIETINKIYESNVSVIIEVCLDTETLNDEDVKI